jgi:hypothetical protein
MYRRVPSLEKLERLTGYRPMMPLASIVELVASDLRMKSENSYAPAPSIVAVAATP